MSYCLNPDCQKPQNRDSVEFCRNCGARLLLKDRYRSIQLIGRGGFGRTFLAIDEDKPSKPHCVVKQFLPTTQDMQHLRKAAQLFDQEAMRLEELGSHPQIPALLAYFSQERQRYLVQEFVNGKNLAALLHEQGAFSETQVRDVLVGLLPVLAFIHSHSVIHRDIKPSNIIRISGGGTARSLLDQPNWMELLHALSVEAAQGFQATVGDRRFSEWFSRQFAQPPKDLAIADYRQWQQLAAQFSSYPDQGLGQRQRLVAYTSRLLKEMRQRYDYAGAMLEGQLALVDFGAAKSATGSALIKTGTAIGSPEYVAPEQNRGKAVFASDLFSLGVTCVHLLTNRSPFDLFDTSEDTWIWRRYQLAPVSDHLGQVLDRLLEPGINRRYQTAIDVLRDLEPSPTTWSPPPLAETALPLQLAQSTPIAVLAPQSQTPPATIRSPALIAVQSIAATMAQPAPQQPPLQQPPLQQPPLQQTIFKKSTSAAHKAAKTVRSWQCVHQLLSAGKVYTIALSPSEPMLASSSGTTIKLWDLHTGQPLRTLTGHLDVIYCLAMSPNGNLLISGSADKSIRLWDLQTGQRLDTIAIHTDSVLCLALSPDGRTLASGSLYDPIKLWDLETKREIASLAGQAGRIETLTFSPDGLWLASGSSDTTVALWHLSPIASSDCEMRLLKGHTQPVSALAFDPDGKTLASGSWDGSVKLWSSRTWREKRTLQPESGRITALTYSLNGKLLVTGSNTLKLWQPRTGKDVMTLAGHTSVVSAIALTGDNQILVSGSWDATIRLWHYKS